MSVYGYVRVSTTRQADGESLSAQQRQIEGYAAMRNLTLDAVLVEEGTSGSVPLSKRAVGGPLLDMLGRGDILVAPKLDRMFRSAADALHVADELKARGVQIHLLDLGGDITGGGMAKFFFTMVAAFAEAERDRIRERTAQSKAHQKAVGRFRGGRLPLGFKVGENGMLIEDDREQQAVRHVIKLHKQGKSLRAIQAVLNAKGFDVSRAAVVGVLKRAA